MEWHAGWAGQARGGRPGGEPATQQQAGKGVAGNPTSTSHRHSTAAECDSANTPSEAPSEAPRPRVGGVGVVRGGVRLERHPGARPVQRRPQPGQGCCGLPDGSAAAAGSEQRAGHCGCGGDERPPTAAACWRCSHFPPRPPVASCALRLRAPRTGVAAATLVAPAPYRPVRCVVGLCVRAAHMGHGRGGRGASSRRRAAGLGAEAAGANLRVSAALAGRQAGGRPGSLCERVGTLREALLHRR